MLAQVSQRSKAGPGGWGVCAGTRPGGGLRPEGTGTAGTQQVGQGAALSSLQEEEG